MNTPGEERADVLFHVQVSDLFKDLVPMIVYHSSIMNMLRCVRDRLREVEAERDQLRINVEAITEKVNRYDREKGQAEQRVAELYEQLRQEHLLRTQVEQRVAGLEGDLRGEIEWASEVGTLRTKMDEATAVMTELLSHTRIIPENGRRVTMAGHGKRYDAALEQLRAALPAPTPAQMDRQGTAAILYRPGEPDADITEAVQGLEERVARLREMVAASHALRCTCGDHNSGGDIRDPRCIEQQSLAADPPPAPVRPSDPPAPAAPTDQP